MEATPKRRRQYCGHCEDFVCHASYYEHRRKFYRNGVWTKVPSKGGNGEEKMQGEKQAVQPSIARWNHQSCLWLTQCLVEVCVAYAVNAVFRKMDAFMETVNERLDRMESMLCEIREELRVAREKKAASKKKRAGNCSASVSLFLFLVAAVEWTDYLTFLLFFFFLQEADEGD